MPISKYRVKSTCLSCGKNIAGPAVAVVTQIKEDNHEVRAYLIHEACQSSMLRELTYNN